jgi:hypothetical protein
MSELDLSILEAIKLITTKATGYQVSYDVKTLIEKDFFRKEGVKKILIDISLTQRA